MPVGKKSAKIPGYTKPGAVLVVPFLFVVRPSGCEGLRQIIMKTPSMIMLAVFATVASLAVAIPMQTEVTPASA